MTQDLLAGYAAYSTPTQLREDSLSSDRLGNVGTSISLSLSVSASVSYSWSWSWT